MSGFATGLGGAGGLSASASSSANSGPATGGALGLNIQGITTGNARNGSQGTEADSGGTNQVMLYGLMALVAVLAIRR